VRLLTSRPDVVACGGGVVQVEEATGRERVFVYPREHEALLALMRATMNAFPHSTLTFRRSAYDTVGGYAENFDRSEDFDFVLRLGHAGRLASIDRPLVRYVIHGDSHSFVNRPKGRDDIYYAVLSLVLRALEGQPGATIPSMDTVIAWLDDVGPEGLRALCLRWALPGIPPAVRSLDRPSLLYLAKAVKYWGRQFLRHRRDPWWAYSSTPAAVAKVLARRAATLDRN
jgi:hypothetical protein